MYFCHRAFTTLNLFQNFLKIYNIKNENLLDFGDQIRVYVAVSQLLRFGYLMYRV